MNMKQNLRNYPRPQSRQSVTSPAKSNKSYFSLSSLKSRSPHISSGSHKYVQSPYKSNKTSKVSSVNESKQQSSRIPMNLNENEIVQLGDGFLGDVGAIEIAQALRHNKVVVSLDLRGNAIKTDGALALADMLQVNDTLQTLILEWNDIGFHDSGLHKLCENLSTNTSLTHLDLRNNRLSATAGISLGKMLHHNHTLKHLDLRWNNLGREGGSNIASALETSNDTLTSCLVSGNKMSDEYLRAIEKQLKLNRSNNLNNGDEGGSRSNINSNREVQEDSFHSPRGINRTNNHHKSSFEEKTDNLKVIIQSEHPSSPMTADYHSDALALSTDVMEQTRRNMELEDEIESYKNNIATVSTQLTAEVQAHAAMSARCLQLEKRISEDRKTFETRQYNKSCEDRVRAEESQRITQELLSKKEIEIDNLNQTISRLKYELNNEVDKGIAAANRYELSLGSLTEQLRMTGESLTSEKESRMEVENRCEKSIHENKVMWSDQNATLRKEYEARMSLLQGQLQTAERNVVTAEESRKVTETKLFEEKLKFEEAMVETENRLRKESSDKINSIVADTSKRLSDLQVARDALSSKSEATALQLHDLQNKHKEEVNLLQNTVDESKTELERCHGEKCNLEIKLEGFKSQVNNLEHSISQYVARESERESMQNQLRKLHESQLNDIKSRHAKDRKDWEVREKEHVQMISGLEKDVRIKSSETIQMKENYSRSIGNIEKLLIEGIKEKMKEMSNSI